MKRKAILVAVTAILLTGCGDPRLDGTSEEAMKSSVAKISAKLDETKKASFEEALQVVAFSKMDIGSVLSGKKTAEGMAGDMMVSLNGKTADEVIAQANVIKAERAAREKAQALEEIAELESKMANAEVAKAELAKFVVSRSRFSLRDKEYSYRKEPIIELTVHNGTAHPISRAYFIGTIASPGRSIPWLVETFNYSISGGLEPNEGAEWALAPSMFGEWGKVDAPADAIFTVEVVRLDGAGEEALFDATGLSEHKQQRLAKLKAQYQVN
ncbi:DUF6694 family lipoprotein [Pseudomonas sp. XK-1]|uniref:DUF6694 family lipoprotein n=1 Tax=Pseudomonas sp. XK-1 TaxID=3136019 RepID=UPI00311A2B78